MDKKKFVLFGISLLIIGVILGFGSCYFINKSLGNNENNNSESKKEDKINSYNNNNHFSNKSHIKFFDETIPGITYTFEIDKDGKYELEVFYASSVVGIEPTNNIYQDQLDNTQHFKVNTILNSINKNNRFSTNDYDFKYDYDDFDIILSASEFELINNTLIAIENIARKTETIDDQTREEFGNEFLDIIYKEVEEEITEVQNGYRKIRFFDYINFSDSEIILKQGESKLYKYENSKVYIDGNITTIESISDSLYIVDIDEDNVSEIITRTVPSNSPSPITNYYHIYKYNNGYFKEIATIDIIGSINYFYIKGKDIKVLYSPYESKPGTIEEKHFMIND